MHQVSNEDYQTESIKLTHIDTTVSVKNFSNLLKENNTYFLNGAWGSGKTEFLIKSEKHSKKKFTTLDFWRVTDERSVVSIASSKLLPKIYWTLRATMILSVVISILMTSVVNLGFSKIISSHLIAQIAGIISLIVAVWSFFKIKSDSFYVWVLKNYNFKNKVLVIDDFDRIEPFLQEKVYTLFNILENRIPIVFVGDYCKLSQNDGKFLQKIIHRKVELPFALQPQNIWDEYFKELEEKLDFSVSDEFKKIVINDQRNLREREQFNDYVNNEFFARKKLNYVQPIHQLLIIYVYLFHSDYYNILLSNSEFEFAEQFQNQEKETLISTHDDILHSLLYAMQRTESEGYPYPFIKNKQAYFLYEQPSNQTVEVLDSFIKDDESLKRNLLSDITSDFHTYITNNYVDFEKEKKHTILVATLKLVKDYNNSSLIQYVINEKNEEIMPRNKYLGGYAWGISDKRANKSDEQIHKEIYDSWHKILNDFDFDFSQELYLLEKYSELHFHALGILFPDIELSIEKFELARRKDFLLITYISSENMFYEMTKWPDSIWQIIEKLPDSQYLSFWLSQGILDNNGRDAIHENKQYILWENKRDFEYPDKFIDNSYTIQKIEDRLNELENKGYTFVKQDKK